MAISGELPELDVSIRETETVPGPKPYTNYIITIDAPAEGLHWRIVQRYSDLNEFHHSLKRTFKSVPGFPRFPGKKFTHQMDPAFIEQRRKALEAYLRKAFSLTPILRSHQLRNFLGASTRRQTAVDLESIDLTELGRTLGVDVPPVRVGSDRHSVAIGEGMSGRMAAAAAAGSLGGSAGGSSPSAALLGARTGAAVSLGDLGETRTSRSGSVPHSSSYGASTAGSFKDVGSGESIFALAALGDAHSVKSLIEKNPALIETLGPGGQTLLHIAVRNNNFVLAQYLLSTGSPVDQPDEKGVTPLIIAAQLGDFQLFSLILNNCRDVTAVEPATKQTALHLFAEHFEPGHHGEDRIAPLLIEKGISVNAQDHMGNTALHYAAKRGNLALMKQLVDANALIDLQNVDDESSLHFAARAGKQRAVSYLVQIGADVNLKGKEGTPLDLVYQKRAQRAAITS